MGVFNFKELILTHNIFKIAFSLVISRNILFLTIMIRTFFFITVLLISISCVREIDDLNFVPLTPEAGVPVGTFTLKANNFTQIGDSVFVQENNQGVIEFYFEKEVYRANLRDRLGIPDQTFNETVSFPLFDFSGGPANQIVASKYNSFTIANSDLPSPAPALEQLIFRNGILRINQSKDFDHQLETTITFPTFIKDGNPISVVLNNSNSFSTSLEMADLDLTGTSGTESNTIDYEISVVVNNTGSDTQGTVSVDFSLESMEFSFMKGDFRTYLLGEIDDAYDIELKQSELPGEIAFTNPSVNVGIISSTGMPFGLDITELSLEQSDGTIQQVTGSFDDQTIMVASPAMPGEVAETNFLIDKNNTDNFVDLLNEIPGSIYFNGSITTNPAGTPASGNFITDSSDVAVNTKFILPLEGYANDYALSDTIKANLDIDTDGVISLEDLNLRIQAENNFPFAVSLQMYFLDADDNTIVLDSLFQTKEDQQIFEAAQVDNSGLVISPTVHSEDISIDREKYERIRPTGHIRILAFLLTPGAGDSPPKSVKVSNDNYLELGIGMKAKAYIDPNSAN